MKYWKFFLIGCEIQVIQDFWCLLEVTVEFGYDFFIILQERIFFNKIVLEFFLVIIFGFMDFYVDGSVLEMGGGWRSQVYKIFVKVFVNCGRIQFCLLFLVYWVLNINKKRFF